MKVQPLADGDVALRDQGTGAIIVSHRFVNVGTGLHIVWVCANCGAPCDD